MGGTQKTQQRSGRARTCSLGSTRKTELFRGFPVGGNTSHRYLSPNSWVTSIVCQGCSPTSFPLFVLFLPFQIPARISGEPHFP